MAVLGIGVSNTPLIKMLLRADVEVTACDKRQGGLRRPGGGVGESWGAESCAWAGLSGRADHDVIFVPPACVRTCPNCWRPGTGSTITSGDGGFFQVCPCKTIAVTGSDGKTTTTTIIAELLKAAGQSDLCGRQHRQTVAARRGQDGATEDVAVLELSSFQLMTMEQSPGYRGGRNLALTTWTYTNLWEEHIAAKENIFTHQGADGLLVLNQDNGITRGLCGQCPQPPVQPSGGAGAGRLRQRRGPSGCATPCTSARCST